MPAPRFRADEGQRDLVDQAPKRTAGGEKLGERGGAELDGGPVPGEFVPVEAELVEEQAVGEGGNDQQQPGDAAGCEGFFKHGLAVDWNGRSFMIILVDGCTVLFSESYRV